MAEMTSIPMIPTMAKVRCDGVTARMANTATAMATSMVLMDDMLSRGLGSREGGLVAEPEPVLRDMESGRTVMVEGIREWLEPRLESLPLCYTGNCRRRSGEPIRATAMRAWAWR